MHPVPLEWLAEVWAGGPGGVTRDSQRFAFAAKGSPAMWNRRDAMIRLGQASIGALALPQLLELEQTAAAEKAFAGNPKAKSCILLYLWGGPPQQDMFDMKPNAPEGIRSIFEPISTSVPGIHMCDQLPQMSKHADKMAI